MSKRFANDAGLGDKLPGYQRTRTLRAYSMRRANHGGIPVSRVWPWDGGWRRQNQRATAWAGVHNGLALLSRELIGWRRTMSIGSLAVRRESDVRTCQQLFTRRHVRPGVTARSAPLAGLRSTHWPPLTGVIDRHRTTTPWLQRPSMSPSWTTYPTISSTRCDEILTLTIGQFQRLPRTSVLGV